MDIILFGMQGSGKGTQGKLLAERYGLKIFDMGSRLREMIASGSPLGEKIKAIVERGDLVDDGTILEVVEDFLSGIDSSDSVLFDGIPRTMNQAEKLIGFLKGRGRDTFALHIKISEKEAITRLTQRRMCPTCKTIYPAFYKSDTCSQDGEILITRQDDTNLDSIQKRLENFEQETMPVIKYFYDIDHLIEVDGEQNIPDVTEEMIEKAGYLFN